MLPSLIVISSKVSGKKIFKYSKNKVSFVKQLKVGIFEA